LVGDFQCLLPLFPCNAVLLGLITRLEFFALPLSSSLLFSSPSWLGFGCVCACVCVCHHPPPPRCPLRVLPRLSRPASCAFACQGSLLWRCAPLHCPVPCEPRPFRFVFLPLFLSSSLPLFLSSSLPLPSLPLPSPLCTYPPHTRASDRDHARMIRQRNEH
jgi:hypothetical protein